MTQKRDTQDLKHIYLSLSKKNESPESGSIIESENFVEEGEKFLKRVKNSEF